MSLRYETAWSLFLGGLLVLSAMAWIMVCTKPAAAQELEPFDIAAEPTRLCWTHPAVPSLADGSPVEIQDGEGWPVTFEVFLVGQKLTGVEVGWRTDAWCVDVPALSSDFEWTVRACNVTGCTWAEEPMDVVGCIGDLDRDGTRSLRDFQIVLRNYGECRPEVEVE